MRASAGRRVFARVGPRHLITSIVLTGLIVPPAFPRRAALRLPAARRISGRNKHIRQFWAP